MNDHANSGDQHSSTKNTGGKKPFILKRQKVWRNPQPPNQQQEGKESAGPPQGGFRKVERHSNNLKHLQRKMDGLANSAPSHHVEVFAQCGEDSNFCWLSPPFNHHFHWLTQAIPTWPTLLGNARGPDWKASMPSASVLSAGPQSGCQSDVH